MANNGLKVRLIPAVSIFDVYNTAVRDLIEQRQQRPDEEIEEEDSKSFLETVYRKIRSKDIEFLPELVDRDDVDEISKEAVTRSTSLQEEYTHIIDREDPPVVMLDIPKDLIAYENKYNMGTLPAADFWRLYYKEYYAPEGDDEFSRSEREFYKKYMRKAIDRLAEQIETESGRHRQITFIDMEKEKRNRLVKVNETLFEDNAAFIHDYIQICKMYWPDMKVPDTVFYTGMDLKRKATFYESRAFYEEISKKSQELLKNPLKKHKLIGETRESAQHLVDSYEKFLEEKDREDRQKIDNIYDNLDIVQERVVGIEKAKAIPVICGTMHYVALYEGLKDKVIKQDGVIEKLIEESAPFYLKNKLMQKNYQLAKQLLGKNYDLDPANLKAYECITPDALKYRKSNWLRLRV